jgi:hypothetical protein
MIRNSLLLLFLWVICISCYDLAFGMDKKVHLYSPAKDTVNMADFLYPLAWNEQQYICHDSISAG